MQTDPTDAAPETYPPYPDDEILPSIASDPVPNPEPEQPSLPVPDPGIFEGAQHGAADGQR